MRECLANAVDQVAAFIHVSHLLIQESEIDELLKYASDRRVRVLVNKLSSGKITVTMKKLVGVG